MDGLKLARELAIWFHRSFGKTGTTFKPGPFVPPARHQARGRKRACRLRAVYQPDAYRRGGSQKRGRQLDAQVRALWPWGSDDTTFDGL